VLGPMVSGGPEWGGPVVISMASKEPEGVALCWGRWYQVSPGGGPRGRALWLSRWPRRGPRGWLCVGADGIEWALVGGLVGISGPLKGPEWEGPVVISMALKGSEGVALCWGRWY
jgi:hypothetical protein